MYKTNFKEVILIFARHNNVCLLLDQCCWSTRLAVRWIQLRPFHKCEGRVGWCMKYPSTFKYIVCNGQRMVCYIHGCPSVIGRGDELGALNIKIMIGTFWKQQFINARYLCDCRWQITARIMNHFEFGKSECRWNVWLGTSSLPDVRINIAY